MMLERLGAKIKLNDFERNSTTHLVLKKQSTFEQLLNNKLNLEPSDYKSGVPFTTSTVYTYIFIKDNLKKKIFS